MNPYVTLTINKKTLLILLAVAVVYTSYKVGHQIGVRAGIEAAIAVLKDTGNGPSFEMPNLQRNGL